jgi:hypothetical protein
LVFCICICIEYVVVPGKRFLYNGRERRPDFIGAGPLGRSWMPQGTLRMQLCLVDGSNVWRCPRRSCSDIELSYYLECLSTLSIFGIVIGIGTKNNLNFMLLKALLKLSKRHPFVIFSARGLRPLKGVHGTKLAETSCAYTSPLFWLRSCLPMFNTTFNNTVVMLQMVTFTGN